MVKKKKSIKSLNISIGIRESIYKYTHKSIINLDRWVESIHL